MDRATYVRIKLSEFRLTQTWLKFELEDRGVTADPAELSKALSGALKTPKARQIVSKSVEIINRYESEQA